MDWLNLDSVLLAGLNQRCNAAICSKVQLLVALDVAGKCSRNCAKALCPESGYQMQRNSQIQHAHAGEQVPTEETCQRDATPDLWQAVQAALLDDLSTPMAIATLSEPLKAMNDLMFTKKGKKVCSLSLL